MNLLEIQEYTLSVLQWRNNVIRVLICYMNFNIIHISHQRNNIFAMNEIHTNTRVDESEEQENEMKTTTRGSA